MGFFQSGSFQHGTAITPHSDVDYIARIYYSDRPSSSTTILNTIRDLLKRELREVDNVYVARPTVSLDFAGLVTRYEITPAYLLRTVNEQQVLLIPAAGGGWREAAPKAHLEFVAEMDRKHHGDVREIARLLKAWKYQNSVPISSFYLEMRAAEYGKNNTSIWSLITLSTIVSRLVTTELAAMNDPAGLVSRISACSSERDRATSLTKLRALQKDLDEGYRAHKAGDRWNFNRALQTIWGTDFPYCDPETS